MPAFVEGDEQVGAGVAVGEREFGGGHFGAGGFCGGWELVAIVPSGNDAQWMFRSGRESVAKKLTLTSRGSARAVLTCSAGAETDSVLYARRGIFDGIRCIPSRLHVGCLGTVVLSATEAGLYMYQWLSACPRISM